MSGNFSKLIKSTLQEECAEFVATVFPNEISEEQAYDIRLSFFAGAAIMFAKAEHLAELDEDMAVSILDTLQNELETTMCEFLKRSKQTH